MQASLKFDKRVRTIARKNRRLARGHTSYIDETGVIRKRPARGMGRGLPIKGLLLMGLGFTLFKAIVLASLSPSGYAQRLALLESGTVFEQAGAWALQIDPVTRTLGGMLNPLF
jgi:hypothetical protein